MNLILTILPIVAAATAEILAQSPQMGWNTWNALKTNYNASVVEEMANLMVSLGLQKAGYNYLVLDEGWSDFNRTSDGYLQSNRTTFPEGIKSLADKIHQKGLKIGLYGDSGIMTCGFRPGSWGYEERDAQTFAQWEVDYLKYDNCGGFEAMTEPPQVRFKAMQAALLQTGRDILYSLCEWGYQFPWHWGGSIGHSYRVSGDITTSFINETSCPCKTAYCLNTGYAACSVTTIIRKMREISPFQVGGHWMDMDMLEIGNANMTVYMQQTHFAFWSALKSPLIIGADLRQLSDDNIAVLTNRDIIALNKDSLRLPVNYISSASIEGSLQVWAGKLADGFAVLIFNEKSYEQHVSVPLQDLGLGLDQPVNARELWSGKSWGKINRVESLLQPYQTLVFRLSS